MGWLALKGGRYCASILLGPQTREWQILDTGRLAPAHRQTGDRLTPCILHKVAIPGARNDRTSHSLNNDTCCSAIGVPDSNSVVRVHRGKPPFGPNH